MTGPVIDPAGAYQRLHAVRRRQRSWSVALTVLAVIVVGLAAATVALSVAGRTHGSSPARGPSHSSTGTSPPATAPLPAVTGTPGGPTITSVTPSQGSPGQTVTIAGSNLFSSNGQVLAYFGDVVAPTACASESSCTATVPQAAPGANRVDVTVKTSAGSSNGEPFTYQ
jgi:hypothetical protein